MQGILLMLLLACVAALLLYSRREAFDGGAEAAIIGGEPVNLSRYPWLVRIAYINGGITLAFCTGALIASNLVLNAGHSGSRMAYTSIEVTLSDGKTLVEVARSLRHPNFKANVVGLVYDIQLLQLKTHVNTRRFPPISLATRMPKNDTPVTLLGMGWKTWYDPDHPSVVNKDASPTKAVLKYASPKYIGKLLDSEPNVDSNMATLRKLAQQSAVMATYSTDGKSGCDGDSGGPMILEGRGVGKDLLLGVSSFGPEGCNFHANKTFFSFAASVPAVRAWIDRMSLLLKCSFTGRVTKDRKTYKCHPNWSWDAGTWDQPGKTPPGLWGKQCARNKLCAQLLNLSVQGWGAKAKPVRYTP